LREMPSLSRQILVRFYLHEQTPEQICADMGITQRQFRLMKWRAKARFAELGKLSLAAAAPAPGGPRMCHGRPCPAPRRLRS
jgi:hypothetical protein